VRGDSATMKNIGGADKLIKELVIGIIEVK